jgi:hypothetical protein
MAAILEDLVRSDGDRILLKYPAGERLRVTCHGHTAIEVKAMKGLSILMSILVLAACAGPVEEISVAETGSELTIVPNIAERLEQFVPTDLVVDLESIGPADRRVLVELLGAARIMDEIFLVQVAADNPQTWQRLESSKHALVEPAREYFKVNFGPWDRLAEFEPFIGDTSHPEGAGFYPVDMTRGEFESWIAEHPGDAEAFTSLFTVIRRDGAELVAVPYSEAYQEWLEPAAERLRAAASVTDNVSLRRFLELRADAFASDDYYESDKAWMDLDSFVEVTIGPYEVYEDSLFSYKAAFEAFVTVDIPAESAALSRYKAMLPWLERNLPIPDEHKNFDRGTESPIRVVDVLFVGGDSKSGIQTLAFNLPNDERVREEKGSKKVMLRNILRAKYDQVLVPIAERVLVSEDYARLAFEAFFNETLHHELSHGLGPGLIVKDGKETEVRLELKEHYSTMEEAKADVMGIYNILALIDKGEMPAELRDSLEATYVAGLFRSARFGVEEAHGQGVVSQFNYLLEKGALEVDEGGRFRSVPEKFPGAIRELLHDMTMLQALGDYEGTAAFLGKYGHPSPALLEAFGRLADVPVDIRPRYPSAEQLLAEATAN